MIPTPTAGGSVAQEVTPVNSHNGIYALLTLVFLSSTCFAENAPAKETLSPELHVSVYDHANVSPELLAAAEKQVHRIFRQAGVETVWRNCSDRSENIQPAGCHVSGDSRLLFWAMYLGMKSAICCYARTLIRSAGSCPGDGLVENCGQFLKEPCSLCHMNPRCCGTGSSVWRLSMHGLLLLKLLLPSEQETESTLRHRKLKSRPAPDQLKITGQSVSRCLVDRNAARIPESKPPGYRWGD